MDDFLQTYGVWLFWGLMIFFMFRMHGRGGGCCSTSESKDPDRKSKEPEEASGAE